MVIISETSVEFVIDIGVRVITWVGFKVIKGTLDGSLGGVEGINEGAIVGPNDCIGFNVGDLVLFVGAIHYIA